MVYRQDEWQAKPYQEKAIEKKGESQRKNEGKLFDCPVNTMIDPATGWFEIVEMKDTNSSADASRIFSNMWLSRYPRPKKS